MPYTELVDRYSGAYISIQRARMVHINQANNHNPPLNELEKIAYVVSKCIHIDEAEVDLDTAMELPVTVFNEVSALVLAS